MAKYSIFKRLSSEGNTVLDFVTFRSWRLNPSIALVPSSSTEKEESTGRRIHLKLLFDNGAESVNGFPHIGVATDNVNFLKSGDVA